jgi:tetratricopeptide (TPR) repeat protein
LNLKGSDYFSSAEAETYTHNDFVEEMPRHGSQSTSMTRDQGQIFNPWLCVDVIGSPDLTGLIGALTLELCEDIPDFNLSAPYSEEFGDEGELRESDDASGIIVSTDAHNTRQLFGTGLQSVSVKYAPISAYLSGRSQYRMPGPLEELYPFPQVAPRKILFYKPETDHLASSYSLSVKELECKGKFKTLKSMERQDIIYLVEDMRSVAWRHYELDHYHLAEVWWRRVIKSSLKIPGHEPLHILEACLWVIANLCYQSRFTEARSLHKDLHSKILTLFKSDPDHKLAIFSRTTSALLLRATGDNQSEAAAFRELLQLCLISFGIRDRYTIMLLNEFGSTLEDCGQLQQAEAIFNIYLQLDREALDYSKQNTIDVQNRLQATSDLARCLSLQQRLEDSASVLKAAETCFGESIRTYGYFSWSHYIEKARLLKFQGRLPESENILRAVLRHAPEHPDGDMLEAMDWLADLLTETNRKKESVVWREKAFLMSTDMYGVEHVFSRFVCEKLGFCYAEVGRYEDAIVHFQQTAGKVALSKTGDPDSRNKYIEEIRDWISEVEEMKEEAEAEETQQISRDFPENLAGMFSLLMRPQSSDFRQMSH